MFPEPKEIAIFITHEGLYEYDVMFFEFCNAPVIFQRLMGKVLS